ncbi:hypothetical protein LZ31DRAFT_205111 [Colletotrichum somersetense]|nr:hypothetical protein LZ31DRAFT_205111 [Colletotrichum somersetense]
MNLDPRVPACLRHVRPLPQCRPTYLPTYLGSYYPRPSQLHSHFGTSTSTLGRPPNKASSAFSYLSTSMHELAIFTLCNPISLPAHSHGRHLANRAVFPSVADFINPL